MKCTILIVLAVAAVASASIAPLPLAVAPGLIVHPGLIQTNAGLVHPGLIQTNAGLVHPGLIQTNAGLVHPAGLVSPWGHGLRVVNPGLVHVPAIQPGYVAATRGSVHVAPLPGNQISHQLNLAPAPGTH